MDAVIHVIENTAEWIWFVDNALNAGILQIGYEGQLFTGADGTEREDGFGRLDQLIDFEVFYAFAAQDLAQHIIGPDHEGLKAYQPEIPLHELLTIFF